MWAQGTTREPDRPLVDTLGHLNCTGPQRPEETKGPERDKEEAYTNTREPREGPGPAAVGSRKLKARTASWQGSRFLNQEGQAGHGLAIFTHKCIHQCMRLRDLSDFSDREVGLMLQDRSHRRPVTKTLTSAPWQLEGFGPKPSQRARNERENI